MNPAPPQELPPFGAAHQPSGSRPWLVLVVVLIVIACFARVARNGMSPIDDSGTIAFQPRLNPPTFTADGVGWYWHNSQLGLYVPLTQMFWALLAKATYVQTADERGFHLDLRVFHFANVLWHAVNVALVYGLIRFLLRSSRLPATRRQVDWSAAAGALLYGLHPLQVEAVAWLSGTKDLMYTAASLASVWLYLRAVRPAECTGDDEASPSTGTRVALYVIGLLLVPVGMLCKPTGMMIPALATALDLCILRRPWRRVLLAAIPYLIAAVPLAIVAKHVQPATGVLLPPIWQRPAISGASIAFYVKKLVVPIPLAFDYDWRPIVMMGKPWFVATGIVTLIATAALLCAALYRRRWPWLAAAILVFVSALLPVLSLVPFTFQYFSTVADHYLTLAMLGPAMLLARVVLAASRRTASAAIAACACAAWFAVLGAMSFRQIGFWSTPEECSRHMVAVTPDSSLGHFSLGEWVEHKGRWGDAEQEFLKAARANDRFFAPLVSLTRLYAREGRVDDSIEATQWLMEVTGRYPPAARPDYRPLIPGTIIPEAIRFGHVADVPRYEDEQRRLFPSAGPATAPATSRPQR